MAKTYRISFEHNYVITTNDIREVILNYEFPDFTRCESIEGEPEYEDGSQTYTELRKICDCDQCKCENTDDYTEDGWTCEECFSECVVTKM